LDLLWEDADQTADVRRTQPGSAFQGHCRLHLATSSSMALYFLRFLPLEHIQHVVIPAINLHAMATLARWEILTYPEYLLWITLFVIMTTNIIPDKGAYWQKSSFPFGPRIDFGRYISLERFEQLIRMHVFTVPDGRQHAEDKLYQIRGFLQAFNDNLEAALEPGRYLCVDESMNQWLGHGMPILKKIPRKPHPIGMEFKTVADTATNCIIRLDFSGDQLVRRYDNLYAKTIATVCRLVEPWFRSGRTVIADSWFGSPAMVRALKEQGLFSIMQVKKKRYWPRGMPAEDIISSLGMTLGDSQCLKSRTDGIFLVALRDIKPKCVIASAGSVSPGETVTRWVDNQLREFRRPAVFDEYEHHKSAVDIANNRRDNMPSFHDVMKTYRWEVRCLSFFLDVAEANAFSAYQYFKRDEEEVPMHFEFRWRLAQSMLEHIEQLRMDDVQNSEPPERVLRPRGYNEVHRIISFGKNQQGKYIRRHCAQCHIRTQTTCLCHNGKGLCKDCYAKHILDINSST
jgi:Transposase IS4